MNKQIRKESHLTNCHWKGMTSSIQPIVTNWVDDGYAAYNERHKGQLNGEHRSQSMNNGSHTTNNGSHTTNKASHTMNGYRKKHRDLYTIKSPDPVRRTGKSPEMPRRASYTAHDISGPKGSMTLERNQSKHDPNLGRRPELNYDQYPPRAQRYRPEEDRQRETSFPARDSREFRESRGSWDSRDSRESRGEMYYDSRAQEEALDRRGQDRRYHTLQPRDVKEYKQYMAQQDNINLNQRPPKSTSNKIPEDVYNNKKTPNDHIFAQYGKETRRVSVAGLPIPLHQLLTKIVNHFSESLTLDMVPLKSLYIQDSHSKIFYQLDDPNDVNKGSYIKINEELVIKNIDRGSSQSLEDLANSSSSSVSSGGFVIPATVVENKGVKRHGKSRLSLVEEKLSMITNDMNMITLKSETGSTHSAVSSQTDFGVTFSKIPPKHLYGMITNIHHNIADLRNELNILRTKEREKQAEMDDMIRETSQKINEEILKIMPQGIRRRRMSVDNTERDYRALADEAYTNIKDLEVTVDVLKRDVVKRKCRLDPSQLLLMEDQLKEYTHKINSMNEQFVTLKSSLKSVMAEELEIIVNEEQFLADEEPMLDDATVKCEELCLVMETLRRVAEAQKLQGPQQLEIYTVSEVDILEERNIMIQSIGALIPNHEERIQSIQAVEDFRAAQRKYIKSVSEQLEDEVRETGQQLRKTDSIAQIEKRREAALKNLFLQQEPHAKGLSNLHRKMPKTEFAIPESIQSRMQRKSSLSKCKSMSSIAQNEDNEDFHQSDEDSSVYLSEEGDSKSNSRKGGGSVKRSKSFNKDKCSDEEKSKPKAKKFANFFGKKSKSKSEDKQQELGGVEDDTMKMKKKLEKENSDSYPPERTSSESRKPRSNGGTKKPKRPNSDSDYKRNSDNQTIDQFDGIPGEKGKSKKGKNR